MNTIGPIHVGDLGTEFLLTIFDQHKGISSGLLSTRTDDNTGVVSFNVVHNIELGDIVDLAWGAYSRTGMSVTNVTSTTVTVDGGSGAILPVLNTGDISIKAAANLSTTIGMQMIFESPSGTATAKTATKSGDGTDGKITYTVDDADLFNEAGQWKVQVYLDIDADNKFHTGYTYFDVLANLE